MREQRAAASAFLRTHHNPLNVRETRVTNTDLRVRDEIFWLAQIIPIMRSKATKTDWNARNRDLHDLSIAHTLLISHIRAMFTRTYPR